MGDDTFVLKNVNISGLYRNPQMGSVYVRDGNIESVRSYAADDDSDGEKSDPSAEQLRASSGRVIDGQGFYLSAGWIDLNVHAYSHFTPHGVDDVDRRCLARGVTTVVDTGSAGSLTYQGLQKQVMERCNTRMYSFLNIGSLGQLSSGSTGQQYPSLDLIDPKQCLSCIRQHPDEIVGVMADLNSGAVMDGVTEQDVYRNALACAQEAGLPLMVEHRNSSIPTHTTQDEELGCPTSLRPGDIYSPMFQSGKSSLITNSSGKLEVHSDVLKADEKGVLFAANHGSNSFSWNALAVSNFNQMKPALVSSGLGSDNFTGPTYDLPTVMTKMLNNDDYDPMLLIRLVTQDAAKAINRQNVIGHLLPGREADMTLFDLRPSPKKSNFQELEDCHGKTVKSRGIIKPVRVWRRGIEYKVDTQPVQMPNKTKLHELLLNKDRFAGGIEA